MFNVTRFSPYGTSKVFGMSLIEFNFHKFPYFIDHPIYGTATIWCQTGLAIVPAFLPLRLSINIDSKRKPGGNIDKANVGVTVKLYLFDFK